MGRSEDGVSSKERILWSLAYLGSAIAGVSSRPLSIARNLKYLFSEANKNSYKKNKKKK